MTYKFKVPILPKSSNQMYAINHYNRSIYLTEEARHFKSCLKIHCPVMKFSCEYPILEVHITLFSPKWICKNKNIRKVDSHNCTKIVYDALSERIGYDDSLFFFTSVKKKLSMEEYTEIEVNELTIDDFKTEGYKEGLPL